MKLIKLEANGNILYIEGVQPLSNILLSRKLLPKNRQTLYEYLTTGEAFDANVKVGSSYINVVCRISIAPYYEFHRNKAAGRLELNNFTDTEKYREGQIFPYLQKKETLSNGCMALNSPDFDLVEQKGIEKNITVLSLFQLPAEEDLIFIKTVDLIKLNHLLGVELSDAKLKMYQQNGRLIELFVGTDLLKVYIQDKLEAGQCRFLYSTYKTNKLNVKYW